MGEEEAYQDVNETGSMIFCQFEGRPALPPKVAFIHPPKDGRKRLEKFILVPLIVVEVILNYYTLQGYLVGDSDVPVAIYMVYQVWLCLVLGWNRGSSGEVTKVRKHIDGWVYAMKKSKKRVVTKSERERSLEEVFVLVASFLQNKMRKLKGGAGRDPRDGRARGDRRPSRRCRVLAPSYGSQR